MKRFVFAGLAIVLAAPAVAQTMSPPPGAATATSPADFVAKAGASDLYERESSKLVLATTKDAKVRDFANMMLRDHTKSTADVKAAAARAGVKPKPPMLMPDQAKMVAALRAKSGPARDQEYWTQQKTAHQMALALHTDYAANGTAAPLKMAAGKIAPVVQHHIEMLDAM